MHDLWRGTILGGQYLIVEVAGPEWELYSIASDRSPFRLMSVFVSGASLRAHTIPFQAPCSAIEKLFQVARGRLRERLLKDPAPTFWEALEG